MEGQDFNCLAEAIYHEARGESFSGQLYVGFVIRNRVESKYFPNDFCSVIKEPWQFSYNHVLNSFEMVDKKAKELAEQAAYMVLTVDKVPIQNKEIKQRIENTCIERYGSKHVLTSDIGRSPQKTWSWNSKEVRYIKCLM